jgi:D-sedoheptulose 7-phosphate isomerase
MSILHAENFFRDVAEAADSIDTDKIEVIVQHLRDIRDRGGRVFVLGVGGSAGNASHMVNDLRKLCKIEAYAPTDNVSEITARTNDEGFTTIFVEYLATSNLNNRDAIFILSVGGGDEEKNVSKNLIEAIKYAKFVRARVFSVVGRRHGYAAVNSDVAIVVPVPTEEWVTPLSEAFQSLVWHCLVSHPQLQATPTKW